MGASKCNVVTRVNSEGYDRCTSCGEPAFVGIRQGERQGWFTFFCRNCWNEVRRQVSQINKESK